MNTNSVRTNSIKISPSILFADFANLGKEVGLLSDSGADWIHLDVMDGNFVPNLTFGADIINSIRGYSNLPFDVHLMVSEPEKMLEEYVEGGADFLTVHAEKCLHLDRVLRRIREMGCKSGIALNPHTPETILTYILDQVDLILLMTVNPGYGGQSLIVPVIKKISRVRNLIEDRPIEISVDGGVSESTLPLLKAAGASVFVAGSSVFKGIHSNYAKNIKSLRNAGRVK